MTPPARIRSRGPINHRHQGVGEAQLTIQIRELLRARGIFHWKSWQGPMSQPKGVADIIGCYKGRFIAIEVKVGSRQLTPQQAAFLSQVERAGGCAFVARSVKDVVVGLRWILDDALRDGALNAIVKATSK